MSEADVESGAADSLSMAAYVGSLRHGLLNAEDAVKKAEEAEKAMAAAAA